MNIIIEKVTAFVALGNSHVDFESGMQHSKTLEIGCQQKGQTFLILLRKRHKMQFERALWYNNAFSKISACQTKVCFMAIKCLLSGVDRAEIKCNEEEFVVAALMLSTGSNVSPEAKANKRW